MSVICKLFGATIAVGVVGIAISAQSLAAARIAALASLRKAPAVDVQTVQWRDRNWGTQYGSDYDYYGPRYRSNRSGNWNPGERLNTETQYGSDYGHYGRRSSPSRAWNPGERSNAGTQYGPDYGYYGPR
jgi:Ni/Co efflux regulator RcnB